MKFTILTKQQRYEEGLKRLTSWHKHFCFKPTRMSYDQTDVRWLEYVLRKGKATFRYGTNIVVGWEWRYISSEFDILKYEKDFGKN